MNHSAKQKRDQKFVGSDNNSLQDDTSETEYSSSSILRPQNHNTVSQMSTDGGAKTKLHSSFIRKHRWKLTFFSLVFVTVIAINLMFAPMMKVCSSSLIAKIQSNLSDTARYYLKAWILIGSMQAYIIIIACVCVFVSRQSAFYYQVCFSLSLVLRFAMRMSFRSSRPFMEDNAV